MTAVASASGRQAAGSALSTVGWFQIAVGLAIAGLWALLVATGGVPELDSGLSSIRFHLTAELATAALLVAAGVWLLRGAGVRGRVLSGMALGALAYTTVNSAGYYADAGEWWVVAGFAGLTAATVAAAGRLLLTSGRSGT